MILSFDIGGSRIRAAEVRGGDVRLCAEAPTPTADYAQFLNAIAGIAEGRRTEGLALSIAGVVDPDTGRIKVANIPCADSRPLAADLESRTGLPVRVLNDADCFALAEARHGAGRGHANVFGIILGTGVGGGLVIGGRLVQGAGGYSGEWGHGPVLRTHAAGREVPHFPCGCGQTGCVDTIGGARGLERLHKHLNGTALPSVDIVERWEAGDLSATRTVDVWRDLLSAPLSMVLNTVGASVVPVGGGLSNAPALIAALDRDVRARILRGTDGPLLRVAECRVEPGLIGAAEAMRG